MIYTKHHTPVIARMSVPLILTLLFSTLMFTGSAVSGEMGAAFLERAEKTNDPVAQYNIGAYYYLGIDVPQDFKKAHYWIEKSAQQGFPVAKGLLGIMYLKGQGVPQDNTKAHHWLEQSAEAGYVVAQTVLGGMYYLGQGVPQDYLQAYKWTALAAAAGTSDDALALLKKIRAKMTAEQIRAAHQEIQQWMEAHQQDKSQ